MADTSYATSQLHLISLAEVNKFLLAYVILFQRVYFRQYFACSCKEYLIAAVHYCQVGSWSLWSNSSNSRDYRPQWMPVFLVFPMVT